MFTILIFLLLGCRAYAQQPKFVIDGQGQGTSYSLQYYAGSRLITKELVDSVLAVIDRSMSLYLPQSLISRFNHADHEELVLDPHMERVVRRAMQVHRRSKGAFDITVKPLVSLWGFGAERIAKLPTQTEIDSVLQFVGMDKLRLRKNKLRKTDKRTAIDLNGIAQGYTVDVLAELLEGYGIENYLVELGGEIRSKGYKAAKQPFEIAIERPEGAQSSRFVLQLIDKSVTTSGNYRKVFGYQGKKIHHHINPKDGYPLQNNVASVTVVAPTAMDADAYDNVFMALSPEEGIAFANKLKEIEVYIIYKQDNEFKEAFSKGFSRYIKN